MEMVITHTAVQRRTIAALVSAVLHVVIIAIFAATTIRIAGQDRQVMPLVIRDPAPPPPPPARGSGGAAPAEVAAPVEAPRVADQPKPIAIPHPEKPKIAAKPRPKHDLPQPLPTPAAVSAPPTDVASAAPAAAGGDGGSGTEPGVIGGVAGGKVGGKLGGRIGGTGDDVWAVDQVAVPPHVLERILPQYPPVARARGQEGTVIVQAIIDRQGDVEPDALQVIKSQPPFDDAAIAAFRRWKFQPGRDDAGQVVRVILQQPIRFQLR